MDDFIYASKIESKQHLRMGWTRVTKEKKRGGEYRSKFSGLGTWWNRVTSY